MRPFRFAVHSSIAPTMSIWRDRARKAEDLGYSSLYVTDHFDAQFGPLVAATVAAEATTSLHVGTLVLNNDLRNPVVLAKEIAALAMAAEGRVEVGLGAGWLRSDYEETGIKYESPGVRIDRLTESIAIMKALWTEGETSFDGRHYSVHSARCDPRPDESPRVIVGGGSKRILTLAAQQADIVGVNTSLASGVKGDDISSAATSEHFDRCLDWVRDGAGDRFDSLELQIVAIAATVVGSQRAAVRSATMLGFHGDDALNLPVLLIGTEDELCDRLMELRERWGFNNIVVPGDSLEVFAPIVARMTGR
ncbi:MAG TPA: TIGR03621 family F420-dependent LLM class oxidoreductase [Acidimicrobiales bacterium]